MLTTEDILNWKELPPRLEGLRVTVLGLARSGLAVTKLLVKAGCRPFVSESARSETLESNAALMMAKGAGVELGGHTERALDCDFIVRSPGIPGDIAILTEARTRGLLVVSEIEISGWFFGGTVVAVTGSNGKTTTVEWLGDLFRRSGCKAAVCGNVGYPFSEVAASHPGDYDTAVVEISSFQLEDVVRFRPRTAVITNFSPDHLDRYDSYTSYIDAKCRIFERQGPEDVLVYNRNNAELSNRAKDAPGRKLSFGTDEPEVIGAGVMGDWIVLFDGSETTALMACDGLSLPGRHNLENALAVVCAGWDLGVSGDIIVHSLKGFPGVPHRLETVREVEGVLWVNDSKATNVASGLVALDSFRGPIILLAGGRDKGSDFSSVAAQVADKVKSVILFGEAGPRIEEAWGECVSLERVANLAEAVRSASASAQPGDVVLLSPMCASFDEFNNYEERGETFKALVRDL